LELEISSKESWLEKIGWTKFDCWWWIGIERILTTNLSSASQEEDIPIKINAGLGFIADFTTGTISTHGKEYYLSFSRLLLLIS